MEPGSAWRREEGVHVEGHDVSTEGHRPFCAAGSRPPWHCSWTRDMVSKATSHARVRGPGGRCTAVLTLSFKV